MTTTFFGHWGDVPAGAWRWPDFSPAEIACRGSGALLIDASTLDRLQALRDRLGKPLIVRSASAGTSTASPRVIRPVTTFVTAPP